MNYLVEKLIDAFSHPRALAVIIGVFSIVALIIAFPK